MRHASTSVRFLVVAVLLLGTALLLHARRQGETIPRSEKLASFPHSLGPWAGQDVALDRGTLQVLGPGDFLTRIYTQDPAKPYIDLFIAYFASQKTGDTIHSPRNCLPGSGWSFTDSQRMSLQVGQRAPMTVNEYIIAKGKDRLLVLYWYQAHGRATPSEYWAKLYLVADAIRMNRTDGALVRVITPMEEGEPVDASRERAVSFVRLLAPHLGAYIPN